jgi:hypothetical protein
MVACLLPAQRRRARGGSRLLVALFVQASLVGARVAPRPLTAPGVASAAQRLGFALRVSSTAALVKVELLDGERNDVVVGETYAFAQPNGVLHWDSIQTRRQSDYYARRSAAKRGALSAEPAGKPRAAFGLFGPSVLLAAAVLAWASEDAPFRCRTAEVLAIADEEQQNRTLVRLYKIFGFNTVRTVDEGFGSVADRLLFGGCGVIMQAPTDSLSLTAAKLITLALAGAEASSEGSDTPTA